MKRKTDNSPYVIELIILTDILREVQYPWRSHLATTMVEGRTFLQFSERAGQWLLHVAGLPVARIPLGLAQLECTELIW